jgi:multidrug efflux system membrane fusion protein
VYSVSFKAFSKPKVLSFVVAFAVLSLSSSCGNKSAVQAGGPAMMMMPAVPVRAVQAISSDVPLTLSAVGNVESMAQVDVKSRVAGQVLRVDFAEGQTVQKGELLFEIDPEPLNRQIAEYQANLAKDKALEQQARANVFKDQATLKQSRSAADRGLELSKEGIFSREQTEQVVATADSNQAALDADTAAVESSLAASKADAAKLAETQLQLDYTRITAPISGRAGSIAVKAGNLIKDNDAALVTILQISPINISFGVPEQLLTQIQKYNAANPLEVTATADGGQNTAVGKLDFIDSSVDNTTGTIKLKAAFPNTDHALWPGQFVNVQARLNLEHNRIMVPSRTIETGPQGKYVWVFNSGDNTVAMRPVTVLRTYNPTKNDEESVIGQGLEAGEMVISEGQMRLAPGAKVRLLDKQAQLGASTNTENPGQS